MQKESLDRWWRVDALFVEASERTGEERRAFLDQACAGEPDLRLQVENLLAAQSLIGDFLAEPLVSDATEEEFVADLHLGRRIGPYRLLEKLGQGGMGTVYLAERDDGQYQQQVALKLVRGGFESREALRRFRLERQILARLQHPNIARLLDGGVNEDGQPYFVMEYIRGLSLTDYCDSNRLPVEARLALFQTVCSAVSYAHRHLIVHRDLKPSNIMVTQDGEVRLLDFGIARLLGQETIGPDLSLTETRGRLMTPEYASPEQIRGEQMTTASDVYQLGLILYELLTGCRPFTFRDLNPHQVDRFILETDPERPSSMLRPSRTGHGADPEGSTLDQIGRNRGTSIEKLRRFLRGDLDTIVLKAIAKEPDRRYGSVVELADDLARYQRGLPVTARRDGVSYRASRFVRRHKVGVGATALVMISLVAGLAATAWQARLARIEAEKARRINGFVQEMLSSVDPQKEGRDVRVAEVLKAASLKVETELKGEPEIEAAVRNTIGSTYRNLGEFQQARFHLERALALRRRLFGRNHPETAESLNNVGIVMQDLGEYDAAEPFFQEALAVNRRLYGERHKEVANNLGNLGGLALVRGDYDTAEQLYRDALESYRSLFGNSRAEVASALNNLAVALMEKGDLAGAEPLYREALSIDRKLLGPDHPNLAEDLNNLAMLLKEKGDLAGAEPLYREALALRRKLLGPDHPSVAQSLNNLARLVETRGDDATAESLYRQSLAIYRKSYGSEHPRVALILNNLAGLLHTRGAYDAAEPLFREVLAMDRKLLGPDHPDVGQDLNNLAVLLRNKGDYAAAEPLFREALAIDRRALGDEHPDVASDLHNLAVLLQVKGKHAEAESLFAEALALRRKLLGEEHPQVAATLTGLARLAGDRGDAVAAERLFLQAIGIFRKATPDGHPRMADALSGYGKLLMDRGDARSAEGLLREAVQIRRTLLSPGHRETAQAENALGACLVRLRAFSEAESMLVRSHQVLQEKQSRVDNDLQVSRARLFHLYQAWGKPEQAALYR